MKNDIQVVLASASPRRKELLAQIGIIPKVMPSLKPESSRAKRPGALVKSLSKAKADDVSHSCADDVIIIGADTVVAVDGEILGKPHSKADARRMIRLISGRRHQVYTGVTVIYKGHASKTWAVKTDVDVYPMTDKQIDEYVETGEPMDKAGAYAVQGLFAAYIMGIRGDYSSVVGLPLGSTAQAIDELTSVK